MEPLSCMLCACPVAAMAAAAACFAVPATATVVRGTTSAHCTMPATWRAGSQELLEQTGGLTKLCAPRRTEEQCEIAILV